MIGSVAADTTKTVHLLPKTNAIKRLVFDEQTMSLRPNLVLVNRKGSVVFEINELGFKGPARDPSRKLVVVWGDSVVFGVNRGWPCLLDEFAPGYQFLNGGIEADPYDNILRRAAEFNRAHQVALNIVMLGWHPMLQIPSLPAAASRPNGFDMLRQWMRQATRALHPAQPTFREGPTYTPKPQAANERVREDLLAFIESTPNTVLVTMPTALNRNNYDQDISPYFQRNPVFYFIGEIPYSIEVQRYLFDLIIERNAITRDVAQAAGVRLLDLYAEYDTERIVDFRQNFFDVLHIRVRRYRQTAGVVYEGIKDLL
jgi:lysophospholipase L1-like esterase